ncbi:hypothetical protein RHGRI_031886 [Rhododendron griersonianum]|uniref:cysteine desulfurase n=1 Tax=Rhododendron griersonianum TaxID=479676 RepID=A0AAV6IFB7_9ERIC|nr:hypothetical protein RHGRI_031886 [Rhododendron griersonianum]
MVTTAVEWVFLKFHPSRFTNPNRPLTSRCSNRLGFRRFSSSASLSVAAAASSSTVSEVDPKREPVSLGHATRPDFPILHQEVNGSKLIYLDNAATSQKPTSVLKALQNYYATYNSNVHRGIHYLSAKATNEYELARKKVATFINASDSSEIVFTRNATEAINLVAYSWGLSNLNAEDEIIVTIAEHHSAIVPWQIVAQKTGAILKFVNLTPDEVPDTAQLKEMLSRKTKLVVIHHVSNMLGSVGAKVLVDACQSVPHMVVDVQNLNADFLVASSHKMCGPTGVGFLYGKSELLSAMPPFLGGGEMISDVYLDHSTYAEPPSRFEAGTPAIAGAIGLGAAIDYLSEIGMQRIHDYEVSAVSQYLSLFLDQILLSDFLLKLVCKGFMIMRLVQCPNIFLCFWIKSFFLTFFLVCRMSISSSVKLFKMSF